MSGRRILLAVSTSRYSKQLVDHAIAEASRLQADGEAVAIDVLYVIEAEELSRVSNKVGDAGFLGMSTTQDLMSTLAAEHHRMALRRVDEVRKEAEKRGFPVAVKEVEGNFVESVLHHAEDKAYTTILITRADRPFISRILFGSEADRVARMARKEGLGHVIIDEES